MTIDTERLRQLAAAATPGPWEPELGEDRNTVDVFAESEECDLICTRTGGKMWGERLSPKSIANAEFIAAANPMAVLALLDEIEAGERADALIQEELTAECARHRLTMTERNRLLDRIEALEGLLREAADTLNEASGADSYAEFIQQCRAALGE